MAGVSFFEERGQSATFVQIYIEGGVKYGHD